MESSAAPLSRSTYAGMLVGGTGGLTDFFLTQVIELPLDEEEHRGGMLGDAEIKYSLALAD
jgi:hypothetical protein